MKIAILHPSHLNPPKKDLLPSLPAGTARMEALLQHDPNPPGVLVLNQDGQILYLNRSARKILDTWREKSASHKTAQNVPVQEIIFDLLLECKQRKNLAEGSPSPFPPAPIDRTFVHQETFYRVRSIPLESQGKTPRESNLLLLIEKAVRGPRIDSVHQSTRFTARERTLMAFLSEGKTNKELAGCIGISEYTVKEHIQRIMRKLKVRVCEKIDFRANLLTLNTTVVS